MINVEYISEEQVMGLLDLELWKRNQRFLGIVANFERGIRMG